MASATAARACRRQEVVVAAAASAIPGAESRLQRPRTRFRARNRACNGCERHLRRCDAPFGRWAHRSACFDTLCLTVLDADDGHCGACGHACGGDTCSGIHGSEDLPSRSLFPGDFVGPPPARPRTTGHTTAFGPLERTDRGLVYLDGPRRVLPLSAGAPFEAVREGLFRDDARAAPEPAIGQRPATGRPAERTRASAQDPSASSSSSDARGAVRGVLWRQGPADVLVLRPSVTKGVRPCRCSRPSMSRSTSARRAP